MIQDTSEKAYKEIIESGLLGKLESRVYKEIFTNGPLTDREITTNLGFQELNKVRPRRNGLARYGLVENCGTKTCNISGKTVNIWRVKKDPSIQELKDIRAKINSKVNKPSAPIKLDPAPDIYDSRLFIEKVLKNLKKSDFGKDIWYFEKLLYETAGIGDLPDGEWELQCRDYKSDIWETFYISTEDKVNSALEWNTRNAKLIESKKSFRVIRI